MMSRRALAAATLLAIPAGTLHAQGTWDAILTVDPYPTPYYSDWDANPDIATLTLINSTTESVPVRIHFNVVNHANRIVMSGSSEPQLIDAGATVIFENPYDVAGSTTHDAEMEEVAARTGRMPEGDYTLCTVAVDGSGFVLAESCAPFSIVYPDPPLLLSPMDGEAIDQPDPLFTWTPVQVPIDYQVSYVVRVVEVLQNQNAAEALRENIPHYEMLEGQLTSLRYPIDAQPLEAGKRYAWSVQALDQNGYTAAGNDGRSEIWTFRSGDGSESMPPAGTLTLTLNNTPDAPSAGTAGLADICVYVDSVKAGLGARMPPTIALDMNVDPAFTKAATEIPVSLYYDTATADWALLANRGTPTYLLYGNCNGATGRLGGLRWIARRANVGDLGMPIDTTSFSSHLEWKFGVLILSLSEWKAGADMPEDFTEPRKFMEDHEVGVKPGVNVFGVLNLPTNDGLRQFLQFLGYDESTITLQGFVGVQNSFSIGGQIGQTFEDTTRTNASAGASLTVTVLSLKASLPRRAPLAFPNLILWKQPTLELTGKVKGTSTWASTGSRDWLGGSVELELGFSIAAMFSDSIVRTVTVGFVHEPGGSRLPGESRSEHFWKNTKAVVKLASDRRWFPFDSLNASIGNPEIELEIALDSLRHRLETGEGIAGKISGELGVGDFDDVGKLEVEVGRKDAPAVTRPRSRTIGDRDDVTTRPRSGAIGGAVDGPGRRTGDVDLTEPAAPKGRIYWKAAVKVGNMSLGEFLRLLASIGRKP
ncbi:MAG TPA: hypothetical protein VFZ69_03325 [Longimicrobiales bacterium]